MFETSRMRSCCSCPRKFCRFQLSLKIKPKTIDPDQVDPSVYYYDEVYDEMKNDEASGTHESKEEIKKGSKYIEGLKQTAELRKAEKDLRKFKRYASDREKAEADGDVSDGDVYITPAYKKKLKEFKELEEQKRRQLTLEKDTSMNFTKTKPKVMIETTHETPTCDPPSVPVDGLMQDDDELKQKNDASDSKKNQPKTIDERREYLREILAKRTVGAIFDQAVERFHKRRALMQGNLSEVLQQKT